MKSKFVKIMFVAALCASVAMIGGAMSNKNARGGFQAKLGELATNCSYVRGDQPEYYNCEKALQSVPSGSADTKAEKIRIQGRAACISGSMKRSGYVFSWVRWGTC